MSTILDWLTPWWVKIALVIALLSGLLLLKYNYDAGVKKEAVKTALTKERAITEPVIHALKLELATIKAASEAEAIKRKTEIKIKTKEYQNALAQTKKLKDSLDSQRLSNSDFSRLLNAPTVNNGAALDSHRLSNSELNGLLNAPTVNNSASGASQSVGYERLKTAHQQCEQDLREALDTAAGTIVGLSEAVALAEALR